MLQNVIGAQLPVVEIARDDQRRVVRQRGHHVAHHLHLRVAVRLRRLVLEQAELPLGCVVAPDHPLAALPTVSLQEVSAHPIALQSKALLIRRYLEAHYDWLFNDSRARVETNSLQLVKMLARQGRHVALTSELDAAPELLAGTLRFVPVRDPRAEPQTVAVAIHAGKPPGPLVKTVATVLAECIADCLAQVRGSQAQPPDRLTV